jgi:hypothetical protein
MRFDMDTPPFPPVSAGSAKGFSNLTWPGPLANSYFCALPSILTHNPDCTPIHTHTHCNCTPVHGAVTNTRCAPQNVDGNLDGPRLSQSNGALH